MKENPKQLFNRIDCILQQSQKPSIEIELLANNDEFHMYPFDLLYKMKFAEQSKKHHPEGNAWIHTLMVVDEAAKVRMKSKQPRILMWSALLHDIGKPAVTKVRNGRITAYGHDKAGAKIARKFLAYFGENEHFINEVCSYVYFHMHPLFIVKGLPFAETGKMKKTVDIDELALLSYCDRTGRLNADRKSERKSIDEFILTVKT